MRKKKYIELYIDFFIKYILFFIKIYIYMVFSVLRVFRSIKTFYFFIAAFLAT